MKLRKKKLLRIIGTKYQLGLGKKKKSDFIHFFFHAFIHVYALGLTTPLG